MRLSKITLLFIAYFFSIHSYAKKIDFIALSEINQWENLIKICQEKNKPVFLMITEYKEKVNSVLDFNKNKANVKFVNSNFVAVRVSSYSTLGETFISLFGLDDDGKFMIFNPQEIIMLKADSVSITWFEKGLARFKNYPNLINKYNRRELNRKEWLDYLDISYSNLGYQKSLPSAYRFMLTLIDDDLKNPEIWDFILNYCLDLNNIIFKTIRNNPKLVKNPEKDFPWKQYYANSYNLNLEFALNNKDSLRMVKMLNELVPIYPDSSKHIEQRLLIEQQFYGHSNQWNYYKETTYNYLNIYAKDSAELYLREASKLYNHFQFDKVDELIIDILLKGVKIESTYDLHISLANVYIINKDYAPALKHVNNAVKVAKTEKQKRSALNLIDYIILVDQF